MNGLGGILGGMGGMMPGLSQSGALGMIPMMLGGGGMGQGQPQQGQEMGGPPPANFLNQQMPQQPRPSLSDFLQGRLGR